MALSTCDCVSCVWAVHIITRSPPVVTRLIFLLASIALLCANLDSNIVFCSLLQLLMHACMCHSMKDVLQTAEARQVLILQASSYPSWLVLCTPYATSIMHQMI